MATVAGDLKKSREKKKIDVGNIPQWRLMVRRFRQSKLSVAALIVLAIMYVLVVLSDFIAPYPHDELETNASFAAPSRIQWTASGPAIFGLTQTLDEERFQWVYEEDPSLVYPIRFFVPGYEYRILGIIPSSTHLFGIDVPEGTNPKPKLFLWGADKEGRDLFSRIMKGSQISMSVGFVAVFMSVVIGTLVGTASGYFGGVIDNVVQRIVELIQSFPDLPLFLALAAALPVDVDVVVRFFLVTLVIGLIGWTGLSRAVRGKVLAYRNADYTNAAKAAGASHWYIITKHMVPNTLSHVIVVAMLAIPAAIGTETALSFLGLGVLPPAVSWGLLLRDSQSINAVLTYPWLLIPVAALVVAVMAFNLLGDGVRDAVDPYG
jgi:peptide/nickel transport system permease protein